MGAKFADHLRPPAGNLSDGVSCCGLWTDNAAHRDPDRDKRSEMEAMSRLAEPWESQNCCIYRPGKTAGASRIQWSVPAFQKLPYVLLEMMFLCCLRVLKTLFVEMILKVQTPGSTTHNSDFHWPGVWSGHQHF